MAAYSASLRTTLIGSLILVILDDRYNLTHFDATENDDWNQNWFTADCIFREFYFKLCYFEMTKNISLSEIEKRVCTIKNVPK